MADLQVTGDLPNQFAQFDVISDISDSIRSKLRQIGELNRTGGGGDDDYAKAYHAQVDGPTEDLDQLVGGFGVLLTSTGSNGSKVSGLFDTADDDSATLAEHWQGE